MKKLKPGQKVYVNGKCYKGEIPKDLYPVAEPVQEKSEKKKGDK